MTQDTGAAYGEVKVPEAECRARYQLTLRIADFVRGGLYDFDRSRPVTLDTLMNAVQARYADVLAWTSFGKDLSESAARRRALVAYVKAFEDVAKRMRFDVKPLALTGWAEEVEVLGVPNASFDEGDGQEPNTAADALRIARSNRTRAQTRIVLLYLLSSHLPTMGRSSDQNSPPQQAVDAASKFLWEMLRQFDRHVMMFSIVIGGDEIERCRTEVLENNLSPGYSVMQYLSQDGVLPGRWLSETEETFFASLKR